MEWRDRNRANGFAPFSFCLLVCVVFEWAHSWPQGQCAVGVGTWSRAVWRAVMTSLRKGESGHVAMGKGGIIWPRCVRVVLVLQYTSMLPPSVILFWSLGKNGWVPIL